MNSSDKADADQTAEFPVADVRKRPDTRTLLVSKLWWVTLFFAIVAFVLAWRSMPRSGPVITIEFPEGHGLQAGDTVRHRGIDVGIVLSASLRSDLNGIQVTVELNPEAEILCRQGSRFWVVRPRVGLTGIEGLETVVGARYIAVSPGPSDATVRREFEGLVGSPPDQFAGEGLELMLKADSRSGLNPGAPVTWRGVQVGQVLSTGLSPDASHVTTSLRISAGYRKLVNSNSKFWVTSGLGVHIGLSGIDLNADSLASLALGGISFITPGTPEPATEVRNGHVFALHPTVDDSWLAHTVPIPLMSVDLPQTVAIEGSVTTSFLGIKRQRAYSAIGTLVRVGNSVSLLTANLPAQAGAHHGEQVPELHARVPGANETIAITQTEVSEHPDPYFGVLMMPVQASDHNTAPRITDVLRIPSSPEECCVVRTLFSDGQTSSVIHTFAFGDLSVRGQIWQVSDTEHTDLSSWNGAPVVSLSDGMIIGVLTAAEQGTAVAPIPPSMVK